MQSKVDIWDWHSKVTAHPNTKKKLVQQTMKKGKATNKAEAEEDENWSRGRDDPGWESGVTEPTKERGRHH